MSSPMQNAMTTMILSQNMRSAGFARRDEKAKATLRLKRCDSPEADIRMPDRYQQA
jgi:hypothetical protein